MKLNWTIFATIGVCLVAGIGFAQAPEAAPKNLNPIVMKVNGDPVYAAEVSLLMQNIQGFLASQGREVSQEEVFQIASQSETTLNELTDLLVSVIVEEGLVKQTPEVKHGDFRLGDVKRNYSDTSKARDKLGWQSETTLVDGLRNTVLWFLSAR